MSHCRTPPRLPLARRAATTVPALLLACAAAAGPITSNTALPVHEGEIILRGQGKFLRSTRDPSGQGRELTVWAVRLVVVYGVTERFTLFGIVPYLEKSLELATPAGRTPRDVSGIGDLRFLLRYTAWQRDRPGETLRLAPFAGVEVPSGDDDEEDALGRLPRPLQLGSGSWDPLAGAILTWQKLAWELDASATYRRNTEANDFRFGDEARLDLSFQYRLLPRKLEGGVPGYLYGVAESNLVWQGRNELAGMEDLDSGGTTWYLAPGIQYVTRRWVLEAAVQLPVLQDLGGRALENDFVVTAGFRRNF